MFPYMNMFVIYRYSVQGSLIVRKKLYNYYKRFKECNEPHLVIIMITLIYMMKTSTPQ